MGKGMIGNDSHVMSCISLHKVSAEFIESGCEVYFPTSGASSVDFTIKYDGEYYGVELKSCRFTNKYGSYQVVLKNGHCNSHGYVAKPFDNSQWSILAIYLPIENVTCYFLPEDVSNTYSINLAPTLSAKKNGALQNLISDFTDINRVLEKLKKT